MENVTGNPDQGSWVSAVSGVMVVAASVSALTLLVKWRGLEDGGMVGLDVLSEDPWR